jgi:thiol-disulfide isomerase/thioredoxin
MFARTLLAIIATCGLIAVAGAQELKIGSPLVMGDTKMKNVDGSMISINDVKGEKGTVVMFWCNHCPFIPRYMDRFNTIVKEYKDQGFAFVAVNPNAHAVAEDSFEKMQEYAKKHDYAFYYVNDEMSRVAAAFGATRTPHAFVFNGDSELVYVGAIDDDASGRNITATYLKDTLEALKAGAAITTTNTRAVGCTIKFPKN